MYFRKPRWDTGISPPELLEFIKDHPPGSALDLGCGTGTNVITLAQNGWRATGVDFIPQAINKAIEKAKKEKVDARFILSDVTKLKSDLVDFDLILDIGCFHSLSDRSKQKYILNLSNLINLGGWFLLYGFLKQKYQNTTGISPKDLDLLSSNLNLVNRKNGDERGQIPSVWLTYFK